MKLAPDARGVYPIAPTPFLDNGAIDTASIDRLVDFYLQIGATGLTVLGQLGEAPKLEHEESVAVATRMIRRAPQLPVVVGVSHAVMGSDRGGVAT
jgi:4-hydroxy-tetrahydrodipicolinate synthase